MTNLPHKPSRINFEDIDSRQIERILSTGNVDSLTPAERSYLDLMEMVRGLRARMMFPGGKRIVTKAGIIKLLKSGLYGLSDWMARQVYADAINFFYSEENVKPRAWANLYAERYEKWADLAASMGKLKEAKSMLHEAAKLRGCYDEAAPEIPLELLNSSPVILYTHDPESIGAPKANRKELEAFIDSIPEIPEVSLRRVKEDAGIMKRNLLQRMIDDEKEFGDEKE
ncbi:MAG: hypothetical protein E7082_07285 [Bacteroidales bacterium]|nr:hypothetical protein [Bacteroidales bacterium]